MSLAKDVERCLARAEKAREAGNTVAEWEAIGEAEYLLERARSTRAERISARIAAAARGETEP